MSDSTDIPPLYKYMSANLIDAGYFKCPTLRFTPCRELNDIMDLATPAYCPVITEEIQQAIRNEIKGHTCKKDDLEGRKKLNEALIKNLNFDPLLDQMLNNLDAFTDEKINRLAENKNIEPSYPNLILNGLADILSPCNATKFREKQTQDDDLEKYGVLSLSATNDDLLCWSYYTQHTGFSIEIAPEALKEHKNIIFNDFRPVKYDKERPLLEKSSFKNIVSNHLKKFYAKSLQWNHEKEYRCFCENVDTLNDHIWMDGCIKLDPKYIKSIIMGARMAEKHKKIIWDYAAPKKIKIFAIKPHETNFSLTVVPAVKETSESEKIDFWLSCIKFANQQFTTKNKEIEQLKDEISRLKKEAAQTS